MRVSAIVVTHNGAKRLVRLLESIAKSSFKFSEVIIVDNGSTGDNVVRTPSFELPPVEIIRLEVNKPLTYAYNLGIKRATGMYVALLHDDTILSPSWLENVLTTVERDVTVAAVQGKILRYPDTNIIDSCGCIVDSHGCEFDVGMGELDVGQYDHTREIFSASGVASLFNRNAILSVGLLDETYESGLDDLDLCWRMRLLGFKVIFNPKAVAYHVRSATWTSSELLRRKVVYEFAKTRLYVCYKNFEIGTFFMAFPLIMLHIAGGILFHMRRPLCQIQYLKAVGWFLRNLRLISRNRVWVQMKLRRIKDSELFRGNYWNCYFLRFSVVGRISRSLKDRGNSDLGSRDRISNLPVNLFRLL